MSDLIRKRLGDQNQKYPEPEGAGKRMTIDESIIRDAIDMTCIKRMAITRTEIESLRDPPGCLGYLLYESIKDVAKAAEDGEIDWRLMHITLQVWDKRHFQALSDHEEKRIQEASE